MRRMKQLSFARRRDFAVMMRIGYGWEDCAVALNVHPVTARAEFLRLLRFGFFG